MAPNKLKANHVKEIRRLYQEGKLSNAKIGAQFGVSAAAVRYQVRDLIRGPTLPPGHRRVNPEKVLHMYAFGHSFEAIGKKLGVCKATVQRTLNRLERRMEFAYAAKQEEPT